MRSIEHAANPGAKQLRGNDGSLTDRIEANLMEGAHPRVSHPPAQGMKALGGLGAELERKWLVCAERAQHRARARSTGIS